MPIRRSAITAFSLLILGSATLEGQQNDRFTEWDRSQTKPAVKTTAKKEPMPPVTYFSSKGDVTKKAERGAQESAQIPMRERARQLADRSVSPAPERMVVNTFDKPVVRPAISTSTTSTKAATVTPLERTPVVSAEVTAKPSSTVHNTGIVRAALESEDEEAGGGIVQVAHTTDDDSGNPFEDFLKEAESERAPSEEVSPEFSGSVDESGEVDHSGAVNEEEQAEALFGGASKKTMKPSTAAAPFVPVNDAPVNQAPETVSKTSSSPGKMPAGIPKALTNTAAPQISAAAATGTTKDDGPQSPGVTVQWVRRGEFNVGQECDVDLVVQNTSKSIVRSVMTEAVIPAEVEVLTSTPGPMPNTDTPTWTFGELQPGEIRTVSLKMVPHQRGDVRLEALVRLTGFSSTEFSVQEPMIGVVVSGPDKVEVGQQVGYVVRVNNPGTGVASNVIIQAAVPEGLEHRSGRILSIEIGTLNPGEFRQAKLSLTAIEGGPQELAVRVVADGDLSDETVAPVLVAEPQLAIEINGPAEQIAGRTSDYTMTVANSGNVPSANVRAKYRLPTGFEFVSADRGGKYSKTDHSIDWFVGTLQPDESSDFKLTLKATDTGEVVHQAGVISEHGHVTKCSHSTTVEGTASLEMKIAASNNNLKKGDDVTWEVRIRNTGSREAGNVGLSCELPGGVQLMEADGPSDHIAENGVMVFRSLPAIEAGGEVVFTIKARCVREGNQRLRMRVASESIPETLIGEESATVSDR